MAAIGDLADLLPVERLPARRRRIPLPRLPRRRPRGLEAVPERYRLQLLLMASGRMPGAAPADVAATAGRLAESVRAPRGLDTATLDRWFRDHAEAIAASLDEILAG